MANLLYAVHFRTAVCVPHTFRKGPGRSTATALKELDTGRPLRLVWRTTENSLYESRPKSVFDAAFETGSGSVFADLGIPDANAHQSLISRQFDGS